MKKAIYRHIATHVQARLNCMERGNAVLAELAKRLHEDILAELTKRLPRGAGFDADPVIDLDLSSGEQIVIRGSYHAMNENGFYVGWIEFQVNVVPSLLFDIDVEIRRNGNDEVMQLAEETGWDDYAHETYVQFLKEEINLA